MSITKNQIKFVRSLSLKKNRDEHHLFVAEGKKCVTELASAFNCKMLIAIENQSDISDIVECEDLFIVPPSELERMSQLRSPQGVIAVFDKQKRKNNTTTKETTTELILALDSIQDPGNLGTIIRLADWFGIEQIIASKDTADAFAPKVVQATMGALARVNINYLELQTELKKLSNKFNILGTFLEGDNIYTHENLSQPSILVMGNEGNGIRPEIEQLVTVKLFIPSYPAGRPTSESLNVAVATAVACAEIRRRQSTSVK